ncbi:kelch repeat and BTB domain-containing protein 4-like [Daphnia carinata]|uniref:kelch repeat and BTB domain-containing protein 4-like n=1 Tax=Daphnia carinata TaxID=120202 RepID=UPI00257A85C1|nr:kelch repeat and BTB domain-containing protein 4-like [Daphnia carinata]
MSISASVHKIDERLVNVNWSFDYNPNVKKSGPLQVDRTYGYSYTYHFELQCNLSCIPKTDPNQIQNYKIQFLLTTRPGENDGSNPTDDADAILVYYRLPCDIWLTMANDVTKHFLEKCLDNKWQTRNISIPHPSHYGAFNGVLSIKFNSIGIGELNAVIRMTELIVQQTHCDVEFVFESGQRIGGHVAILSVSSPVFEAMFTNDMVEAKTGRVVIADIEADIFKDLLHYIYTGRTATPLTEPTAQSLYVAAEKYDIEGLQEECVDFLLFHVQLNNAIDLMIWADVHSIIEIKEPALKFVAEHFRTICQTAKWADLMKNHPELCLRATRMMK